MIFKRRDKPPFWGRLREVLYPRKGFWRGMDYVRRRLHRLPDSPHRIALGFACGAFISFTPFFTLHFFLAAGMAWAFRANILASIFGTAVGNPLTFPFIATGSLWLGRYLLGRGGTQSNFEAVTHARISRRSRMPSPRGSIRCRRRCRAGSDMAPRCLTGCCCSWTMFFCPI
jgi:uncharacterized protein (DUF2062 family)